MHIEELVYEVKKNAYTDIVDNEYLNNMSIDKEVNSYSNKYSLNDIYVAILNDEDVLTCI